MLRLGTRPDSARMSSPDELITSSDSPLIVLTEIGTALASSVVRCAVTVTVCSLPASGPEAASIGAVAWPWAAEPANARPIRRDSGLTATRRPVERASGRDEIRVVIEGSPVFVCPRLSKTRATFPGHEGMWNGRHGAFRSPSPGAEAFIWIGV